jgi:hypothetical protein
MTDTDRPTEVTLNGETIRLSLPEDEALRMEIAAVDAGSPLPARWAALGACWRGRGRPKASPRAARFDFRAYGHAVYHELRARGVNRHEITAAGTVALYLLVDSLIDAAEVSATEDFTDPTADASGTS